MAAEAAAQASASLPIYTSYISFWSTSTLLLLFIPFINYTRSCSQDLGKSYKSCLEGITVDLRNPITTFVEVIKLHRGHERENQQISYSFWSYIGLILSSGSLFTIQYEGVDGPYFWIVLVAIVLLAIFFAVNFVVVISRHLKTA